MKPDADGEQEILEVLDRFCAGQLAKGAAPLIPIRFLSKRDSRLMRR